MKLFRCKIFRYFLFFLFLGFLGSISFFNHTHVHDGNIIVHSHPFKKGADGKPLHGHSGSSYLLMQLLNHYVATVTGSFAITSFLKFPSGDIAVINPEFNFTGGDICSSFLRGPPVLTAA